MASMREGLIGVPAEALPGLDLVHDGRGCGGAVLAIDGKGASPMHGGVGLAPHLSAFELVEIDNRILGNPPRLLLTRQARLADSGTTGGYGLVSPLRRIRLELCRSPAKGSRRGEFLIECRRSLERRTLLEPCHVIDELWPLRQQIEHHAPAQG